MIARQSVLIVEDDNDIRVMLADWFVQCGYEVTVAADAPAALRKLNERAVSVVLADVGLPGEDGIELTRRIRASANASLPIILLTANLDTSEAVRGMRAGANDYLTKPIDLEFLRVKIDAQVREAGRGTPTDRGTVVLVMRAKGGVGATSVSVNLAAAFAEREASVVLDLDLQSPNAALALDVLPSVTLSDLHEAPIAEYDDRTFDGLIGKYSERLRVLTGCISPERAETVTPEMVGDTIDRLRSMHPWVIVDTAAHFDDVFLAALDRADHVCLVTSSQLASLKPTIDTLRMLEKLGVPSDRTMVVLNRVYPGGAQNEDLARLLGHSIDMLIPQIPRLIDASDRGVPLAQFAPNDIGVSVFRNLGELMRSPTASRGAPARVQVPGPIPVSVHARLPAPAFGFAGAAIANRYQRRASR